MIEFEGQTYVRHSLIPISKWGFNNVFGNVGILVKDGKLGKDKPVD